MNALWTIFVCALLMMSPGISAQDDESSTADTTAAAETAGSSESDVKPATVADALSLDELLEAVRSGRLAEEQANELRMQRFRREQANQKQLLQEIIAEENREEAISKTREATFEDNETRIVELEDLLKERLGSLK